MKKYLAYILLPLSLVFVGCGSKSDVDNMSLQKEYFVIKAVEDNNVYLDQTIPLVFSPSNQCNTINLSSYNANNKVVTIRSSLNENMSENVSLETDEIREGYSVVVNYCKEGDKLSVNFDGNLYNLPVSVKNTLSKEEKLKDTKIKLTPSLYNHNSKFNIILTKRNPIQLGIFNLSLISK